MLDREGSGIETPFVGVGAAVRNHASATLRNDHYHPPFIALTRDDVARQPCPIMHFVDLGCLLPLAGPPMREGAYRI